VFVYRFVVPNWTSSLRSGSDPGGGRLGRSLPLAPKNVTLFTMFFYNSENSIRDIRLFCRPLFCHSSVVKYTSSLLQQRSRYDAWLTTKYCWNRHLTLLAGSALSSLLWAGLPGSHKKKARSTFGNGNGNGLLFHMTQPVSRSTIKAIACSKPTISEH